MRLQTPHLFKPIRFLSSVLILVPFILLTSCSSRGGTPRTEQVLGTVCTINAYDEGTDELYGELFARLTQIDNEFSVTKSSSELSEVNRAAGSHVVAVTDDVLSVLKIALQYAELSDGAFDPTIGPLVKLWGINTDHARVPSQQEIDEALPLVNWRNVLINGNEVILLKKGMSLDLGGIAKGYAADEMVRILKSHNVQRAIIDLGGNVYVYGTKKNKSPWKVGVKDPDNDDGDPALLLSLTGNNTVVTSGVYERFFLQDGKRYHHILNTKTGYPADSGLLSATIVTDASIDADALSTISFIMGAEKSKALYDKLSADGKRINAIFIKDNHDVVATVDLEKMLSSNNDLYSNIQFILQ